MIDSIYQLEKSPQLVRLLRAPRNAHLCAAALDHAPDVSDQLSAGCAVRTAASVVVSLEVVYFVHAPNMRPSFLHAQTRNAQATHQNRKVTGTVNNIFNKASIGL